MADLPDPSTLSDEELSKLLGEEPGEKPVEEPEKPDEAKPESKEEPEEKEEPEKEEEEEKPEEEEKKPSPREQRRIRDLLQKYGDPETPKDAKTSRELDYEKELDADAETVKRLKEDRDQASESGYTKGLEQAKSIQWNTRLEIDAPRVDAKYPQLDQNSSEFKKEAAQDVNDLYLALSGYDAKNGTVKNPDIRYATFVDTVFGLVNDLAEEKAAEVTKQIRSQAAKTGLRPDGSSTKKLNLNKAPQDMTDEELDAYLAQAIPK